MTTTATRRNETRSRTSSHGWRQNAARWSLPIGGGAAALIAALMLAAPLAGASSSVTSVAPFSHLVKNVDEGTYSSGCYSYASTPVIPSESPVTGWLQGWDRAATGSCSNSTSSFVIAEAWGDLTLTGFKFTGASTGWATVNVSWTLNWTARATVSGGTGSSAYASSYGELSAWLTSTSGNYTNGSAFLTLWSGSTTSGTTWSHSHGMTYWVGFTAAVMPGATYYVNTALYTEAYTYTMGGGTAWSEFDFGAPGLGGALSSVTVS